MPCIFTIDEKDKIIHFKIDEPFEINMILDKDKEAYYYSVKYGIKRFLVDLTESRNTADIYDLRSFAQKQTDRFADLRFKMRLALLVLPDDNSFDPLETVMYNAGHQVKQFTDHKEAIGYLKDLKVD